MKEDYQKTFKELTWFFPLNPVSFYLRDHEKQKEPGISYQSLFGLQNMVRKIYFLVIYHPDNFDDLMQSGFWVNLCKPIHDVIILLVSSDSLNLETVERKEKKLQKIEYTENVKTFFDKIQSVFLQFLKCFLLVKYKK